MNKFSFKTLMCIVVGTAALAVLTTACGGSDSSDSSGVDADSTPNLPPVFALVPDFDDFTKSGTSSSSKADVIDNYAHAAAQVGFWNFVLRVGLGVPVAAFLECFNHEAVQQDDGSWVWSYSLNVGEVLHTAELRGAYVGDEVHWEMYITKEGFYADFLWYSGVSNLAATAGSWTIKESPDTPLDLLRISWERSPSDDTWDVEYLNIKENGPEQGGYIHYGVTNDEPYDAFYDIYNKGQNNLVEIEANRATEEGRVKNERHFGDSEWHYWDSSHSDIEAPS